MRCRICGNTKGIRTFTAKEMMFGTRESFEYFECPNCKCLQASKPPQDMSKYYRGDYYASTKTLKKNERRPSARNILKATIFWSLLLLGQKTLLKQIIFLFPETYALNLPKRTQIKPNSSILEVGCGRGDFLSALRSLGFSNLLGIDPYAEKGIEGVEILRCTIQDLPDDVSFDLIVFNHSLEHIEDQIGTLAKTHKLLSENGTCLIRVPVKTEYIWNRYGVEWVQLDAPRHIFLHTTRSMKILAEKTGFEIETVIFDSTEFQFYGSEQYKQNIPLRAANSHWSSPEKSIFNRERIEEFKRISSELNAIEQGDQAQFYLVKAKKRIVHN